MKYGVPSNHNLLGGNCAIYAYKEIEDSRIRVLKVICTRNSAINEMEDPEEPFNVTSNSLSEIDIRAYVKKYKNHSSQRISFINTGVVKEFLPEEDYNLLKENFDYERVTSEDIGLVKNGDFFITSNEKIKETIDINIGMFGNTSKYIEFIESDSFIVLVMIDGMLKKYISTTDEPTKFAYSAIGNQVSSASTELEKISHLKKISRSELIDLIKDLPLSRIKGYGSNSRGFIVEHIKDSVVHICRDCSAPIGQQDDYFVNDNGDVICNNCSSNYRACADCFAVVHYDNLIHTLDNDGVCNSCYEAYYTRCHECYNISSTRNWEENEDYCPHCESDEDGRSRYTNDDNYNNFDGSISNYTYKPDPIFYEKLGVPVDCDPETLYMGIELEVNRGKKYSETIHQNRVSHEICRENQWAYCKWDSSVRKGFELVTHPCTIQHHVKEFPKVLTKLREYNYQSEEVESGASLHIHVNKNYFGTGERLELGIAKLVIMFDKFWDELYKFSRRDEVQIHWCKKLFTDGELSDYKDTKDVYEKARNKSNRDRHSAINLNNEHTVEFRLWRGTLDERKFKATICMTQVLCMIAKEKSVDEILDNSLETLISSYSKKLAKFCKTTHVFPNQS